MKISTFFKINYEDINFFKILIIKNLYFNIIIYLFLNIDKIAIK
jgi:hypothetical protein